MKRFLTILTILISAFRVLAQHNDFQSLYMYDALTINPAYAGSKGALVLNANYRDQWGGVAGSPETFSVTSHLLTKSKKTGLGFSVLNDRYGIQNKLKINAVYAYKIRMKTSEISLGIAGGIRNESVDLAALNLNSSDDAAFLSQPRHGILPDVAIGAVYKSAHLLFGVSAPDIVRLDNAYSQQAVNGYFSALLDIGQRFRLKPSALVKYLTNSPVSYEGNLTFFYRESLSFGFGARNDLTGNAHLRLQLSRQFAVAYLYERNYGAYSRFLRNTHEFMINYTLDYKTNVQSPRYL